MERAVKVKKVTVDGKRFAVNLMEKEMETIRREAEICKLNGWSLQVMKERLPYWLRKYWPEVAEEEYSKAACQVEVGMGATEYLWSDRRAKTIVRVVSPKEIVVMENETKCIDFYASKYEVLDTMADYMGEQTFTLRRNGTWVEKGQPKRGDSVILVVGYRHHYIDPNF